LHPLLITLNTSVNSPIRSSHYLSDSVESVRFAVPLLVIVFTSVVVTVQCEVLFLQVVVWIVAVVLLVSFLWW